MQLINIEQISKLLKQMKIENSEEIVNELNQIINKTLEEKIKTIKNKKRIIKNDDAKEHFPVSEVLNNDEIKKLPSWIKKDIDKSVVIGKSLKIIQTNDGKKYHINNKLNDLPGNEWTFFLNSVINTRYSTNGQEGFAYNIRKIHPSPKPPQLMKQIIEFFTKENELVFDYFMGVGGTLLGASLCNRRALGIDLNLEYIQAYKMATKILNLKEQLTIQGNSIDILKSQTNIKNFLANEEFSLILIDPPYGDMMSRNKTGEKTKKGLNNAPTPFTNLKEDLGNMDWKSFRHIFKDSINNAMNFLKNKGHIVIFLKDLQPKDKELNLLHADVIMDLNQIKNLKYLGTKIWADQSVNLYPYGYPFSYVSNQIHQYIIIFRKE